MKVFRNPCHLKMPSGALEIGATHRTSRVVHAGALDYAGRIWFDIWVQLKLCTQIRVQGLSDLYPVILHMWKIWYSSGVNEKGSGINLYSEVVSNYQAIAAQKTKISFSTEHTCEDSLPRQSSDSEDKEQLGCAVPGIQTKETVRDSGTFWPPGLFHAFKAFCQN